MAKNHFLKIAKEIWGDTYDYSKFVYTYAKDVGEIICNEHGSFFKSPNKHTRKGTPQGCPKCSLKVYSERSQTAEEMLERFRQTHGDRYDYNLPSGKIRMKDKVEIICREHGSFYQTPDSHIRGNNCSKCAGGITKNYYDFIKALPENNFKLYDYSGVEYFEGYSTLISIYCKTCRNTFEQRALYHVGGKGCPECNKTRGWSRTQWVSWCESRGYKSIKVYLISLKNESEDFYKIGMTYDIDVRFRCKTRMPYDFKVIDYFETSNYKLSYDFENKLKRLTRPFAYTPEISFSGEGECFTKEGLYLVLEKISEFKKENI